MSVHTELLLTRSASSLNVVASTNVGAHRRAPQTPNSSISRAVASSAAGSMSASTTVCRRASELLHDAPADPAGRARHDGDLPLYVHAERPQAAGSSTSVASLARPRDVASVVADDGPRQLVVRVAAAKKLFEGNASRARASGAPRQRWFPNATRPDARSCGGCRTARGSRITRSSWFADRGEEHEPAVRRDRGAVEVDVLLHESDHIVG